MKNSSAQVEIDDAELLPSLYGDLDNNLRLIERTYDVNLQTRGNRIRIEGAAKAVSDVECLLNQVTRMLSNGVISGNDGVRDAITAHAGSPDAALHPVFDKTIQISNRKRHITAKNETQRKYIDAIENRDIVFGIGPAGTGKTYLAMAMATAALLKREVSRILLVRPAVEAGEKLGFLPGDLQEKVNPYLRPLYDALFDMVDMEKANKLIERGDIEIAPLAFMRGRTLNDSFIILDEAQNTTPEQMKMFLTRLGFNSKTVITGDITQIDLPSGQMSGLIQACTILDGIDEIRFVHFTNQDVVRHKLVQRIVRAYEKYEATNERKV